MDLTRQFDAIDFLLCDYAAGRSAAISELKQLETTQAMVQAVLRDLRGFYCCPANAFLSWSLMRSLISIRLSSVNVGGGIG